MAETNVGQFDFSGASRCNQGATFIQTATFFNDAAKTDPQVLTGLEFRMQNPVQQPGPWCIPGSAADPFRSLRPLPWGSVGVVYIWTEYGWIPERRCRCWQ